MIDDMAWLARKAIDDHDRLKAAAIKARDALEECVYALGDRRVDPTNAVDLAVAAAEQLDKVLGKQ